MMSRYSAVGVVAMRSRGTIALIGLGLLLTMSVGARAETIIASGWAGTSEFADADAKTGNDGNINSPTSFGTPVTFAVTKGQSYASGTDIASLSHSPVADGIQDVVPGTAKDVRTRVGVVEGTYIGSIGTISMAWRTRSESEITNPRDGHTYLPFVAKYLASDVVNIKGIGSGPDQQNSDYVVQMSYSSHIEIPDDEVKDVKAGTLYLGQLVNQTGQIPQWVNAILGNYQTSYDVWVPGTRKVPGHYNTIIETAVGAGLAGHDMSKPFEMSWNDFRSTHTGSLALYRSAWGVDQENNTVWAVLNYGSGAGGITLAVVPEPSAFALLAAGAAGLGLLTWCRRRAA